MLDLDPTLPAELGPLQWLIGQWEGTGVVSYRMPDGSVREHEFGQRVSFSHAGLPALSYESFAWLLDNDLTPLAAETGSWRLSYPLDERDGGPGMLAPVAPGRSRDDVEALRRGDGSFEIEVLLAHPTGVAELYLGTIAGPRIDLATDAVVRSASAKPHAASKRMLGLVDDHLLWAWDLAALGQGLATHASARLARSASGGVEDGAR